VTGESTRPRPFAGDRLVIASHNPGKVTEINDLLRPLGVTVVSAQSLNLVEPDETETTFRGNASLKAIVAAKGSGLPALADDSGLVVDALDGAPGVLSARWAGPEKDFNIAMARVLSELEKKTNRSARFVCALALAWPDGHCETFEGKVEGKIALEKRGSRGFGYDPIFLPIGMEITFGEMEPSAKHAISHRAMAFRQLLAACFATDKRDR